MLTRLTKLTLAAGLFGTVSAVAFAPAASLAASGGVTSAWGDIEKDGSAGGTIHVTSGDGQSWTKIESSQFTFPVRFTAKSLEINPLNRIWVVQGSPIDVNFHDLYDTDDPGTGLQGPTFHSDTRTLSGATLYLTNSERSEILSACNARLKPFANEQQQRQTEIDIPIVMVMQVTNDGVGWTDGVDPEGVVLSEEWRSVEFALPVVCEGFTRATASVPDGVVTPDGDSKLTKVELALSNEGGMAGGTLEYVGSCPTGLTLNMGWFTTLSSDLKSYVQHKSVTGGHDWNSSEFSVTTNQAAPDGLWKTEKTDFMTVPFGGAAPGGSGGGQVAIGVPGNGLQAGGSGGGGSPQNGLAATNSGSGSDEKRYVGFFRLVAYQSKKTVPVLEVGGGWTNKVVYTGQKMSPWRKYDITCEPKQSTVAGSGPDGLVSPPRTGVFNPDDGAAPQGQTLKGDFAFFDHGAPKCVRKGKALITFNSPKADNIHYSLDCTMGSISGVAQAIANPNGPGFLSATLVSFDVTKTGQINCALKTVAPSAPKVHTLKGHLFECATTAVDAGGTDLAATPRPQTASPSPAAIAAEKAKEAADLERKRAEEARARAEAERRRQAEIERARKQAEIERARREAALKAAEEMRRQQILRQRALEARRRLATPPQPQRRVAVPQRSFAPPAAVKSFRVR